MNIATSENWFIQYGNKHGLRGLKVLMEYCDGDSLIAAKAAYRDRETGLRNHLVKKVKVK